MNESILLVVFLGLMAGFLGCSGSSPDLLTTSNSLKNVSNGLLPNAPQSGTVQISIPVDTSIFNNCTGELVDLVGTDHLIVHQTIQNNNINLNFSENFKDIVGTGETSGDSYATTSTLHDHVTVHKGQSVSAQQKIVMTGPTTQLTIFLQLHITISANGTVSAFLDGFTSTCVSLI
jgi:hypothetical protein